MKLSEVCKFAVIFLSPLTALAQGGPPMITDDPGTPGDGHWEINIAGIVTMDADQGNAQFPYFDINYGLGERIQLKAEAGWDIFSGDKAPSQTGISGGLLGVKFRFLDEKTAGVSVSTYPQLQFSGTAQPNNGYFLPIEASKTFGNWAIDPEVGYLKDGDNKYISYGIVAALENVKPWEPLFEFHAFGGLNGPGTQTFLNAGFRYAVDKHMNMIGALGHALNNGDELPAAIDLYLGVQLEL